MADWADLPSDLLPEIFNRLDVVGFIRFGAVCVAWHQSTKLRTSADSPKSQLPPWLLLSSSDHSDSRHCYSLSDHNTYRFRLPDLADHLFIGSSHGFLISVGPDADIHATNPVTGAHLAFPPASTNPCNRGVLTNPFTRRPIAYLYKDHFRLPGMKVPRFYLYGVETMRKFLHAKAVLSPSADLLVVFHVCCNYGRRLVCARPGDISWTDLFHKVDLFNDFEDAVFHKGRLHAITFWGRLAIFDPDPASSVPALSDPTPDALDLDGLSKRYLVESPDGESLFLLSRNTYLDERGVLRTESMSAFILDSQDAKYGWREVEDVGDFVFFVGLNYSFSLSTCEHPSLKGNRVFITEDGRHWIHDDYDGTSTGPGVEVYNLEDGSKEPFYCSIDLVGLNRPPPLWFVPTLT